MDSPPRLSRLHVGVLVATACAVVVVGVLALGLGSAPRPHLVDEPIAESGPVEAGRAGAATAAREVLRRWDARRARAWASGDPAALRELYVPGSAAGRHDVAMLQRWVERSLRVSHLQTQVLGLSVQHRGDRRLVLSVTDRVAGATTSGHGHSLALPVDAPTTYRIELRRLPAGPWRVAEVSR